MGGQKYFKGRGEQTSVWGEYTKYNKINSNSENFRAGKIAARGSEPLVAGLSVGIP